MLPCGLFVPMSFVSPAFRTEAAACLRLAGPLILAQLSFVGMTLTDTILAGWLGGDALSAVAIGWNLWTPFFLFFLGICAAVSPVVAQQVGSRADPALTGGYLHRALSLALLLSLLWWGLLKLSAPAIVGLLGVAPETAALSLDYLRALSWGTPGACVFFVLRSANEGMGYSRPVMICGLLGLVANALLVYALMFGAWGLPALGVAGAGYGTAIVLWLMAVGLGAWMCSHWRYAALRLLAGRLPRPARSLRETLAIGLPIGTAFVLEVGVFSLVGLLMARFSAAAVAAHQIAITFAAFTFMMPVGIALATTARVGQAAGAQDAGGVRLRGRVGITLAFAIMLPPALLMTLAPQLIVTVYTDDPTVSALAETLLRLAGLWQIWDGLQVSAAGALRGLKDTRVTMLVCLLAYWFVALPLGGALAFTLDMGPTGLWWGLIAGLMVAAFGLNLRFYLLTKSA
jgi:MATE family multidrug resistance protein